MVKSHNWLLTSMVEELLTGLWRTTPAGGQNWTETCNLWILSLAPNHSATLPPLGSM